MVGVVISASVVGRDILFFILPIFVIVYVINQYFVQCIVYLNTRDYRGLNLKVDINKESKLQKSYIQQLKRINEDKISCRIAPIKYCTKRKS